MLLMAVEAGCCDQRKTEAEEGYIPRFCEETASHTCEHSRKIAVNETASIAPDSAAVIERVSLNQSLDLLN